MVGGGIVARTARAAADALARPIGLVPHAVGSLAGWVRVFGPAAMVVYRPVSGEWSRRRACGQNALLDRAVLDGLMGLPVGATVEWAGLTTRERHAVERAGAGAVRDVRVAGQPRQVVRLAVAPVVVDFALVPATDWREGLREAGRFAPFCARGMLLDAGPDDEQLAATEAGLYGIGVYVRDPDADRLGLRALVEPGRYQRSKHSPAQWRFAEAVYEQLIGPGAAGALAATEEAEPN